MVEVDVVVIGAGFAGLRALWTLRGMGLSVAVLEASDGIGGVWHANGYPGARCDVESFDYSYRFSPELEQEWSWSERYATQPEILRYVNHVADRFDLRRDIHLNTRVERATWNQEAARWTVEAAGGGRWRAQYVVMAVGQLSAPKTPDYPGQDRFQGTILHSARWPKKPIDFTGKRVGIIGTGSSGVQMTPVIAAIAERLTVFQRTANFSIPAANAPITQAEDRAVKADYRARREQARNSPSGLGFVSNRKSALDDTPEARAAIYETAWNRLGFGFALAYHDILLNEAANETAADFIRSKIAAAVADPVVRERLTPRGFPFAARRPSVDGGYFQAFNRDNVELVDLRASPIDAIVEEGVRTSDATYPLDYLIWATGFDAFTGSIFKVEIVGQGGLTLREKWADGPVTYLGVGSASFPNLFFICGPGSPSLLSNVLLSTEEQVDWLASLLAQVRDRGAIQFETTPEAERDWVEHVNLRAQETLYPKVASYYMGAEVEGKPRVFMPFSGGVRGYRRILERVAANGYEGFKFTPAAALAA